MKVLRTGKEEEKAILKRTTVVNRLFWIALALLMSLAIMVPDQAVALGDVTFTAISDAHICGIIFPGDYCNSITQVIRRERRLSHALRYHDHPDDLGGLRHTDTRTHAKGEFVVNLGDNIEDFFVGRLAVGSYYATVYLSLPAGMNSYTLLGNHDIRSLEKFDSLYNAVLRYNDLSGEPDRFIPFQDSWEVNGWQFLALNSGADQAYPLVGDSGSFVNFTNDQLGWLEYELSILPANSKSAILFWHHPVDKDIYAHKQGDHSNHYCDYIELLTTYEDRIKAVFTGHRHNSYHYDWDLDPSKAGIIETYTVGSTGQPKNTRVVGGGLNTLHAYQDLWMNVNLGSDGSLKIDNEGTIDFPEVLKISNITFHRSLPQDESGNASVKEGYLVTVTGSIQEAGISLDGDYAGTAVWSDGVETSLTVQPWDEGDDFTTRRYAPAGPAVLTVDITIETTDPVQSDSLTSPELTVNNLPPLINYIRLSQGPGSGLEVKLNGGWQDGNDLCTVIVDWGDRITEEWPDQPKSFTITHDYASTGSYDVTVWVSDGEFTSPSVTNKVNAQVCEYDETKLTANDAAENNFFGIAVAVDGEWAVIGASNADGIVADSGAAYIYKRNGDEWVESGKLMASDGSKWDYFGTAVSMSGNRMVVGAPFDDDRGTDAGSAYVFEWNGSNWEQTAKLLVADLSVNHAYDRFGSSVSVDNDIIVIGAPGETGHVDEFGAAYVYKLNGTVWEETKLTASNPAAKDRFGKSVSVNGNRIVVGAPGQDWYTRGSVYVYELNGNVWEETKHITASNVVSGDTFGEHVSLDGNRFVVGTWFGDDAPPGVYTIYIYELNGGGEWTETILTPDDSSLTRGPGGPVSISGDRIVGGAPLHGGNFGSFYFYEWKDNGWVINRPITAEDSVRWDQLGMAVAVSGDTFVIGSPQSDSNGPNSGDAYIFDSLQCTSILKFPEAVCQDFTLALDENGTAVLNPSDIDGGSSHPGGAPITLTIDKTEFNCGEDSIQQTVMLTVTDDNSGVQAVCDAIVTVEDNVAPIAVTRDITVQLDESGSASISAADVDNGSSDACGIAAMSVSQQSFDFSNVGDNTVTLTVTDYYGNESTATAVVTVEGNVVPAAITQDTDQDWIISDFELLDAIDDWAAGTLGDFELLDCIDFWAAGCYHWEASSGSHKAGC